MKKLLALAALCVTSFSVINAATITRVADPYLGSTGTSTVVMCNTSLCTPAVTLGIPGTSTNSLTTVTTILITYEDPATPGSIGSFSLSAALIHENAVLFPGYWLVQDAINGDRVYIREIGRGVYEYFVRT